MSAILVRILGHLPIFGNPHAFMSGIVSSMNNLKSKTS